MSRLVRSSASVGLAGLLVAALCGAVDLDAFFRGWLAAFIAVSAVPIGALAVLFFATLVPGEWAEELAPALTRAAATLPLVTLFLVPILVGVPWIYPWAGAAEAGIKGAAMTVPLFVLRAIVYFGLWIALAFLQRRRGGTAVAASGLILWALTGSLAGIDWAMSIEPDFHSSVFGLFFLAHQLVAGLAFAIIAAPLPHRRPGALGAVLLSTCLLWAYLGAMQFIIIWSGDLPDETSWYLARVAGGWTAVLWAIFFLAGAIPFALLLSAKGRSSPACLLAAAGSMLVARALEAAWLVLPAFTPSLLAIVAFIGATAGMGGLLLAVFGGSKLRLGRREADAANRA
jgi:hypothetical protein